MPRAKKRFCKGFLYTFGLAGWTLTTVPPHREVLQTKSIQLARNISQYNSGEPVNPMYITEINERYIGDYLDGINPESSWPSNINSTLQSVDRLGHLYCPSYHAELNEDGAFVMTRDEYGNGSNCKIRRRRKIQSPKAVEVFSTAEKTGGGIGKRLLVSNFGNLIVKDNQGCTRWDLFSQLGDKDGNPIKFPDVTDIALRRFITSSNWKYYLVPSNAPLGLNSPFTRELRAGEGLMSFLTSEAFILMENGASVLYDNDMNVILHFDQELGSARSMRLNSNGDLITYDCAGNIISTIRPGFISTYINHMTTNYPGIFIGVDHTVNGDPSLVLYVGRDDLGIPILKYSNDENKTGFNPFPIFGNAQPNRNKIIASDQLFERNDIIYSEDEQAIVRHIYGEGIHIFTRGDNFNKLRWTDYKTLLAEEELDGTVNTIANLIRASGQKVIYGATYRLTEDGDFVLDDVDSFGGVHQVFDNVPITSIFENHNLETDFTHLISQNQKCLATVNDLAISIYERESTDEPFDFSEPHKTISPATITNFDDGPNTRFYVDKRGALKFVSGSNQILFESEPRLKLPASSLTGSLGNRFALTLNNDCSLVTNRVDPDDGSIPSGGGNEWDSSDDNRDGLVDLQNSANTLFEVLDTYKEIVAEEFIMDNQENLPEEDNGNLWDPDKRIPFLTYTNAEKNLYCRASSLFGELVLEDYYTGEIIWHQPNLPSNAPNHDSYIRLSDHATNGVRRGGFRVIDPNNNAGSEVFNSLYHIAIVHQNFDSHRLEVGTNVTGNECALNYIKTIRPSEIVEWSSDPNLISTQTTPGSKRIAGSKEELLLSELASEDTTNSISSIEIFPNPTENGELNVMSNDEPIWKIDIMALNGTLVTTIDKKINKNNRTKIDIDYLKQGVYILKFYNEDESVIGSKKLIVDQ